MNKSTTQATKNTGKGAGRSTAGVNAQKHTKSTSGPLANKEPVVATEEDEMALFADFVRKSSGKESKVQLQGDECVIYTRVSTKEQADNNGSLESQK